MTSPLNWYRTALAAKVPLRVGRETCAGLFLISFGLFVLWATSDLAQGTLKTIGPGMLPRWLAVGVILLGAIATVSSIAKSAAGASVEIGSIRGPLAITVAIIVFAVTVRNFGLAVAGPLVVLISSFATTEARLKEIVIFSILMTSGCILLFRYCLGQPIPVLKLFGLHL